MSPRSYLGRNSEPVDEGLIFDDVIGGVEVEANGVAKLMSLMQHEDDTRIASSLKVGAIKIHCPILQALHQWWLLCLRPFQDNVDEGLGLDCGSGDVANVEPVELEGPLRDAPVRVPILDNLAEGAVDTIDIGWWSK